MMALLTVGHGPQDRAALGARLTSADVGRIVDVRRFPGSRSNPDVRREALEEWLPALGIGYRWDARLGGRRSSRAGEPVEDGWWTVAPVRRLRRAHPDGGVRRRPRRAARRGSGGRRSR